LVKIRKKSVLLSECSVGALAKNGSFGFAKGRSLIVHLKYGLCQYGFSLLMFKVCCVVIHLQVTSKHQHVFI